MTNDQWPAIISALTIINKAGLIVKVNLYEGFNSASYKAMVA